MFDEINKQIAEIKEKLRMRSRLNNRLAELQQSINRKRDKLRKLEYILQKESSDVGKLEGLSIVALFHTILGSKAQQVEKERQEYLAAKLRYDECKDTLSALQNEMESARRQMAELCGLEQLQKSVVAEKERLLVKANNEKTRQYLQLTEELAEVQVNLKELEEAFGVGETILEHLAGIIESLRNAKSWGTWDMLGGGMIATAVKHSKLDNVRRAVHNVQQLLHRFQRELGDVNQHFRIEVEVGQFETFADYFFDGIVMDWIVQSKIRGSLEEVIRMESAVRVIVRNLQKARGEVRRKLVEISEKRQALIEAA